MKENRQLLVLTHLSQLLDFVSGIGGFVVPLILWLTKKDEIRNMDETGKAILNFRISMFIYVLICIPLILLLPQFYELTGVWIAFPIADVLSAGICFFFLRKALRKLPQV